MKRTMLWRDTVARALLCAAVVGTVGCAQDEDATIDTVFDPCAPLVLEPVGNVDVEQRASISRAIGMWNTLAGSSLLLEGDTGAAEDAAKVPVHFDPAGTAFHGFYDDEIGVVFVNEGLQGDEAVAVTVAHEVGHAFGLLHVDPNERPSVMNSGNLKLEPNTGDREALTRIWGACPARESAPSK